MTIPLNLAIGISAQGIELFDHLQGAIGRLGATAGGEVQQNLTSVANLLSGRLLRGAAELGSPLGVVTSAIRDLGMASQITPQAIDLLANSLQRVRLGLLAQQEGFLLAISSGKGYQAGIAALTKAEQRRIAVMEAAEKGLRSTAAAMRQSAAAAREASKASGKVSESLNRQRVSQWKVLNATNVLSASSAGLMLAMSVLRGNIIGVGFGLIFLKFSIIPVTLAVAALAIVVGGLIKLFSSVSSEMQNVMFNAQRLRGELADSIAAWRDVATFARVSGRALDDVAAAYAHLQREGALALPVMAAAADLAAARNITLKEAAKLITQAVGLRKMDRDALEKLGVARNEFEVSLGREAVLLKTSARLMEIHAGAAEDWASRQAGAMGRARGALESALAVFRAPMMIYVIEPLLNALANFTGHIADLIVELWKTESVQRAFAKTVAYARGVIVSLTKAYEKNEELIRWFLRGALENILLLFRGLIWVGKTLVEVLISLVGAWRAFTTLLKPVWDKLRMISSALKEMGFDVALSKAKEWSFNFPEILKTALIVAAGYLVGGPKGALLAALASLLGDLIIELLPFEDELKEALHRIWDWTVLGGVIGTFFGHPLIGAVIGAGIGVLVEQLDEKSKQKIQRWFEENFPVILLGGLAGGIIAAILGLPLLVGALAGAMLALLIVNFEPVKAWFEEFGRDIADFFDKLAEDVLSWYVEGMGRFLLLPRARAGLATELAETRRIIQERQLEREAAFREARFAGLAGAEFPGTTIAGVGRFAPGAAPIYVNVTGNYILDDPTAERLARQIGDSVMTRLASRYGLGATR